MVGWTPDYVGSIKSKVVSAPNYISHLIKKNHSEITNSLDESFILQLNKSLIENRVVYSAGFDTVHDHLKEYFKDNTTETEWTIENILEVLSYSDFKWFKTVEQKFNDPRELFTHVRINKKAFPGHYSNLIAGKTKGSSEYMSRNVAYRIYNLLKTRPIKNMYLWNVLGREKDIKINGSNVNKEVGTRAVLCCENPATILLMWFAQKISFILSLDKDKTFNVSHEFDGEKMRNLINKGDGYDWRLEADWSYYDSNIDTNFLKVAGFIMLAGLPEDRLHKNIIYYIIKSFVTKYVVLPPGVVVELNRAQPSGQPFGTLVNCYVNTIYWSLIGYKIYGKDYANYMSIEVYGDDTYAYFKDTDNLKNIDKYVAELGLKSEPLIDNFRLVNERCDDHDEIDFLKRRIKLDGLTWNHKKMFDKLLYQSKNRSLDEQIELLFSYADTCPYDESYKKFLKILLKDIYNSDLFNSIDDWFIKDRISKIVDNGNSTSNTLPFKGMYTYRRQDEYDIVSTYSSLYAYSSWTKYAYDDKLNIPSIKFNNKTLIIGALAFTIDQINNEDVFDIVFGERSPPELKSKSWIDLVKEFYDKEILESTMYIRRVFKRKRGKISQ